MALNTARLRSDLSQLYDEMQAQTDPATAKAKWLDSMADLLERFTKSAAVVGTIITTGSATTQTGQANLTIQ